MRVNLKRFKKELIRTYLDIAELYAKTLELDKAKEYLEKAAALMENEDICLECRMARARNLIEIIREMKRVIS